MPILANRLHIKIPAKLPEMDEDISSSERERLEIRNTPVINSKFAPVWQRMRVKIKTNHHMKALRRELKLYGTNTAVMNEMTLGKKSLLENKDMKTDLLRTLSGTVFGPKPGFFIILPSSKFKTYWNILLIVLLIYTATLMPYNLAFRDEIKYDAWWWIDIVINILFGIDVLINCVSAYYDSESTLIISHNTIFWNYAKTWLIFDLIACFPFNFIMDDESEGDSQNYNNLARLARIPRLYRLFRISRLFKMLKYYRNSEFMEKFQEFLSLKNSVMRLMTFFLAVIICIHVMSCIWFFSAKLQGFAPETWVVRHGYMDDDTSSQYLASAYWAFTTLTTVGYGDIHAYTNFEMMLSILWIIFGICFFSVTIGSLSSMLSGIDTKESVLTNKLAVIDEFAKESKLSKEFKIRLRHSLKYSTEKAGFSWDDKQNILTELPKGLRYEVALAMHRGAAKNIPFFSERDTVFVSSVVPFLKHMLVEALSFVYLENEYADEIYFISKGRVSYTFGQDNVGFRTLLRGSYFGDIEVIQRCLRKYSVRAIVNCHLLIMNKPLIAHILKEFPIIWKEMNDVANKRNKLNKLGIKQMKELIDLEKNGKLAEKPIKDVKKLIYNINDQSKDFTPTEVKSDRYKEPSIDEVETILESSNRDVNRLENTVGELLNVSKELLALVRETSHGYLPPIKAATLALNLTDSIIEPKSILNIPSVDISIFTMERTQLNISSIEKGDFEYEELH